MLGALFTFGSLGVVALAVLVTPRRADAAPNAPNTSLVIVADAQASKSAVSALGASLPSPWRVVDDAALRKALTSAGQRTAPGIALGSKAGRDALVVSARAAATSADVGAVLFVRATPSLKAGRRTIALLLVSPSAPDAVVDATVETSVSDEGAGLLDTLSPALARLAPAGPALQAGAPPALPVVASSTALPPPPGASDAPDPVTPSRARADHAVLEIEAGGGTASRFFGYHDGLSPELRSYDLAATPNLLVDAAVYPFARLNIPVLRGLGIAGGYQHAVGLSSKTASGTSVSTNWGRAEGDLRLRLALGRDGQHLVGIRGGVVQERFAFTTSDASLASQLPDVDYLFWRVGAFGRASAGPVAFLLDASYLPAIASGELANRFRQTFFAAVELSGGLAVPLSRFFELRATATYTRVFYSFDPSPGDENVAGGALDNIVRTQITASFHL